VRDYFDDAGMDVAGMSEEELFLNITQKKYAIYYLSGYYI
jgi:hypothetical protein